MDAESREAVFEALRAKGIKAIKVVAADGSKANGEVGEEGRGNREQGGKKGKVWYASAAAVLALLTLFVLFVLFVAKNNAPPEPEFLTAQTRRQVIGDMAIIEKGINTGWAEVFEHEGERFLASFAIPGVKAGQRNTTADELLAAINRPSTHSTRPGLEAEQIISMVEGMKAEARAYIKAGGSIIEYGRRLTERQDAEIAIYERAKADFEAARKTKPDGELVAYWETINDKLRNLGIRLVPLENSTKE